MRENRETVMSIRNNLQEVLSTLPEGVRLVAVSKFHPVEALQEAYDAGQRIFGESKVQELSQKEAVMPKDVEWHFIGHLQTNKVKYIAPYVTLIHGVDSFRLLQEIDRQGKRVGRVIPCLLQMHIAQEDTKFGFAFDECREMLASCEWKELTHVALVGLMGMASNTDDEELVKAEFARLHQFFIEVKRDFFIEDEDFKELSMGMSDDYPLAVAEGSTLVRVGSRIFGIRNY